MNLLEDVDRLPRQERELVQGMVAEGRIVDAETAIDRIRNPKWLSPYDCRKQYAEAMHGKKFSFKSVCW